MGLLKYILCGLKHNQPLESPRENTWENTKNTFVFYNANKDQTLDEHYATCVITGYTHMICMRPDVISIFSLF